MKFEPVCRRSGSGAQMVSSVGYTIRLSRHLSIGCSVFAVGPMGPSKDQTKTRHAMARCHRSLPLLCLSGLSCCVCSLIFLVFRGCIYPLLPVAAHHRPRPADSLIDSAAAFNAPPYVPLVLFAYENTAIYPFTIFSDVARSVVATDGSSG